MGSVEKVLFYVYLFLDIYIFFIKVKKSKNGDRNEFFFLRNRILI